MKKWHPEVVDKVEHYVFVLVDPRTRKPFYVGKGVGNRVFSHQRHAGEDVKVENAKQARIREIEESGHEVLRIILRWGLDDDRALEVEAAVIDALGTWVPDARLTNLGRGHGATRGLQTVDTISALFHPEEAPRIDQPTILVSLNTQWHPMITPEDLRYHTTHTWTANGKRRDNCELIMGVHNGAVRSVYRIVRWDKSKAVPGAKRSRSHAIIEEDPEAWDRHVGTSVSRFLRAIQWSHIYADSEVPS